MRGEMSLSTKNIRVKNFSINTSVFRTIKEHAFFMAFCGQCGFLLPPEATTTCPRCSSTVTSSWESADPNADAPTIISTSDKTQLTEISYHSRPELVQEPNQFAGSNNETQTTKSGKNIPIPPTTQGGALPEYYAQAPYPPPDSRSQTNMCSPQSQGVSSPGYTTI